MRDASISFDLRIEADLLEHYLSEPVEAGELRHEAEDREFVIRRLVISLIQHGIDPPREAVSRALMARPAEPVPAVLLAYVNEHYVLGKSRSRRPWSHRSPFTDIAVMAQYDVLIAAGHDRTSALRKTAEACSVSDSTVEKILAESKRRYRQP